MATASGVAFWGWVAKGFFVPGGLTGEIRLLGCLVWCFGLLGGVLGLLAGGV
jgi:hypothetical protein